MQNDELKVRLARRVKAFRILNQKKPLHTEGLAWKPFPNTPQEMAFNCDADEIFYGGAAGGGKTDLGLGKAALQHRRVLTLRRTFPQLRAMIDRSHEIYGGVGTFNRSLHTWSFPDGRTIQFGSCQHDTDKAKYQGQPHDFIHIDEASEFLESQVTFITAWARTNDPSQRVQVLLTGNPPLSPEGLWVMKRYAPWLDPKHPNPAKSGELRYFVQRGDAEEEVPDDSPVEVDGELVTPRSRTFIPARVQDNPVYMESGYLATLQSLPEPLRSMLLEGNFTVGQDDDPLQVIPTDWVVAAQNRWEESAEERPPLTHLGVDIAYGGKDNTVIALRRGAYFDDLVVLPGYDTTSGAKTAAHVLLRAVPGCQINIDVIGWGAAAYEHLQDNPALPEFARVVPINSAEASGVTDRTGNLGMSNMRAELWWSFREALDPECGHKISLPPDRKLLADLTAPRWGLRSNGITIESKDEIRKRLGRSTDYGDAVVYAWGGASGGMRVEDWLPVSSGRKRETSEIGYF